MNTDDLRHNRSQNAPKKPRFLAPLVLGSIALHLLILWAIARLPVAPVSAPEALTEIQLSALPAPTATASKPEADFAVSPPTPRSFKTPRVQPTRPLPARPLPREVVSPTPLVRSTREVSKDSSVAKKSAVPRATATPRPQRTPDTILPGTRKTPPNRTRADEPAQTSAPQTKTQPAKTSPLPDASGGQNNKTDPKRANGKRDFQGLNGETAEKTRVASNADAVAKKLASPIPTPTAPAPNPDNATQSATPAPFSDEDKVRSNNKSGVGLPRKDESERAKTGNSTAKSAAVAKQDSGGGGKQNAGNTSGNGNGPFGLTDGVGEGPRRIVYILDVSYSMGPRLERAKQELRNALSGLQPNESFNIVAFYGNVRSFDERLVQATPVNLAKGLVFIDSLRVGRYTNMELAFEKAFVAPGVNVVVLITDGVPTSGLGSPDFSRTDDFDISANFGELARRVRQLNRAGARIYTVGIVGVKPDGTAANFEAAELLQRIATESAGNFLTVRIDAEP